MRLSTRLSILRLLVFAAVCLNVIDCVSRPQRLSVVSPNAAESLGSAIVFGGEYDEEDQDVHTRLDGWMDDVHK